MSLGVVVVYEAFVALTTLSFRAATRHRDAVAASCCLLRPNNCLGMAFNKVLCIIMVLVVVVVDEDILSLWVYDRNLLCLCVTARSFLAREVRAFLKILI